MKKIFLITLAFLILKPVVVAQKIDNSHDSRFQAQGNFTNPFLHKSFKKGGAIISDWYSVLDLADKSSVGANLTLYVTFLLHDSLSKQILSDGSIRYSAFTSAGHILDPKDDLLQLTDKPQNQLSKFNSYTFDSLAFTYVYVRNVDSISNGLGGKSKVVDTLFIAYYAGDQISKKGSLKTGEVFAGVGFDQDKRLPANYTYLQTVLLSSYKNAFIDSTSVFNYSTGYENSWNMKVAKLAVPPGIGIQANSNGSTENNLVGFTLTFKSGIRTVIDEDTVVYIYSKDPSTAPGNMRRTNYFGCRTAYNKGATGWDNRKFYNTSLLVMSSSAYGTINGWAGYIPGVAFIQDIFLESLFHLKVTGTIGTGIEGANPISIQKIYPNPAKTSAVVSFDLTQNSPMSIEVHDLLGQTLQSVDLGMVNPGKYEFPMDLSSYKTGIYLIHLRAGNYFQTQKLMIGEN